MFHSCKHVEKFISDPGKAQAFSSDNILQANKCTSISFVTKCETKIYSSNVLFIFIVFNTLDKMYLIKC